MKPTLHIVIESQAENIWTFYTTIEKIQLRPLGIVIEPIGYGVITMGYPAYLVTQGQQLQYAQ